LGTENTLKTGDPPILETILTALGFSPAKSTCFQAKITLVCMFIPNRINLFKQLQED